MIDQDYLQNFVALAFKEDIGNGDHTSFSCIPAEAEGKARLLIKQEGVLAGVEVAEYIFHYFDNRLRLEVFLQDGCRVKPKDVAFTVEGSVRSILQCERLVLNVMQHMSGIATQTAVYVDALKGYHTQVIDTRKTTPGMRLLDKAAVRIGGGSNHRTGLYDMILVKDNHVDFAGGIPQAIDAVHKYLETNGMDLRIEIEARSLEDVETILRAGGVDRIMLDNFDIPNTMAAVKMIAGKYETESSGGITLANIRDYAACGVDFISVGALTHHISSLDMSLKAVTF